VTDPRPRARPLHLDGKLHLTCGNKTLQVDARGDHVVVDVDSLGTLRELMDQRPSDDAADHLSQFLQRAEVNVEIRCDGHAIARLGPDADPGWLEKMLQIKGIDVSARGLLKSLFRKRD
jgi:hypothetical protein